MVVCAVLFGAGGAAGVGPVTVTEWTESSLLDGVRGDLRSEAK